MKISGFPDVSLKSLSPALYDRLNVEENGGKLSVPVSAIVPPELIGAGAGLASESGALCIQGGDPAALQRAGLDTLRLGDVVALQDVNSTWGHGFHRGAVGIGVVSSTDSIKAGYGPGVTVLMSSPRGEIEPVEVDGVNIGGLLDLPGVKATA
jgi:hypothetical protein